MDKYHVYLDGQGYILEDDTYIQRKQPSFVNRFSTGDYSYGDLSFWQFWVIKNLEGAGQDRIGDKFKYKRSYGISIDDYKLKLYHKTQLDSFSDSEERFLVVYQDKLWALGKTSGKVYYTSDGSTWTLLTTLNPIKSYVVWNNTTDKKEYLMIGQSNGDICQIDGITNNDTWHTGVFSTIDSLGVYEGDLYAGEDDVLYKVDSTTTRLEISRYGYGTIYRMITTEYLYMIIHRNGNTIIGYYNGTNLNESYQFNNFIAEDFIYSSTMYIAGYRPTLNGGRIGQLYKISGELQLELKEDDSSDYGFYTLYPLDYLHLNDNRSGGILNFSSTDYYNEGLIYTDSLIKVSDIEYFNGKLYWSINAGIVSEISDYLDEGYLLTSWYDGGSDLIDKIWGEILIELEEGLNNKGSIEIYYRYSEDDDFTLLLSDSSLKFISERLNINNANKIQLKIVLKSSVSTFTPTFLRAHLKYVPRGYNMSAWAFTVKCENNLRLLDGTKETLSGLELKRKIDKLNLGNIFTFIDITGESHQVILTDFAVTAPLLNNKKTEEFRVALELLEVNEYILGVWGKTTYTWEDFIYKWGDV